MARLTVGQKAKRLLAFLMGLGNRQIMRALQPFGFDQAALDEGWALLRRTTASHLDVQRPTQPTREQIARLDAWENRWFPIASAVLERHHPEVHAKVFLNLSQTQGNQVVVSVGTLVERIDALPATGQGEALATLIRHGVTNQVLDDARGMLAQLRQSPPVEEPPEGDEPVIDPAAEDAMWSYYLLWSAIARRAISDRACCASSASCGRSAAATKRARAARPRGRRGPGTATPPAPRSRSARARPWRSRGVVVAISQRCHLPGHPPPPSIVSAILAREVRAVLDAA